MSVSDCSKAAPTVRRCTIHQKRSSMFASSRGSRVCGKRNVLEIKLEGTTRTINRRTVRSARRANAETDILYFKSRPDSRSSSVSIRVLSNDHATTRELKAQIEKSHPVVVAGESNGGSCAASSNDTYLWIVEAGRRVASGYPDKSNVLRLIPASGKRVVVRVARTSEPNALPRCGRSVDA
jgi:hypothetical protein